MSLDQAYDTSFAPPAAVVPVVFEGPTGVAVQVQMLLDTGADCTVIPTALRRTLSLPAVGVIGINVIGSAMQRAPLCATWITVASSKILVRVVALDDEAILGRDLLMHFVARLDGPGQRLRLTRPGRRSSTP